MTLPNALGTVFGLVLTVYGLFGTGDGYNDVERPLRDEERNAPPKPFTRRGRFWFTGFGLLLVILGLMGKFNG